MRFPTSLHTDWEKANVHEKRLQESLFGSYKKSVRLCVWVCVLFAIHLSGTLAQLMDWLTKLNVLSTDAPAAPFALPRSILGDLCWVRLMKLLKYLLTAFLWQNNTYVYLTLQIQLHISAFTASRRCPRWWQTNETMLSKI